MATGEKCFFKERIVTTGPTPVPESVHAAMASSVLYHRGPAFAKIMKEVRTLLPKVFGTTKECLVFSGSGTMAMEGAIVNFFNSGDEVISINSGKFGERWGQQARVYGCKVHELMVPHGEAVKLEDVESCFKKNPNARGILVHASETSTGVRHDVKSIAAMAKSRTDCLTLVDGVTALAVFSLPMDKWELDVVVGGSQKGFLLPPGISFGSASDRAWARAESVKSTRYYLDWRKERKAAAENTGAFTSPVTLIGGLLEALRIFESTGLENVYKRGWKMCEATRAAAVAMGFELLVANMKDVSSACTAIKAEGSYTSKIRERFGMTVSGGQDALKGKIVRIGHMGYIDAWDVLNQIIALGQVAQLDMNRQVSLSAGVDAFFKVVNSETDCTPEDLKNA